MLHNYLVTALRSLFRHKLFSLINIVGLTIGLAACLLIAAFVRDELSYDRFWKNSDSLYRLQIKFQIPGRGIDIFASTMGPAREAFTRYFADDVERATRFTEQYPIIRAGDRIFEEPIYLTDPETAEMFDFDMLAGDMRQTLNDSRSIALSDELALKYFGRTDVIGETMTISTFDLKADFRVGAVYRKIPNNSTLEIPAMIMINPSDFAGQGWMFDEWFSMNVLTYFQLRDGASIASVNSRLDDFANKVITLPEDFGAGKTTDIAHFFTIALPDIQLKGEGMGEMKATGSMSNVLVFAAIALLILAIACINFMNLSTARSTKRAAEVSLRKVLGANRRQLILQFLGETFLIVCFAMVLAVVLVEALLPVYSDFIGKTLALDYTDGTTVTTLVLLVLTVSLLGGAYPAFVLSSFRPAHVLKANKSADTPGSLMLRNLLVVLQFSVSITLIVGTVGIYAQKIYATSMDPGFNRDQVLVLHGVGRTGVVPQQQALKDQILRLPGVAAATYANDFPGSGGESNTSVTIPASGSDRSSFIKQRSMDADFFKTFEIKLLAGRDFNRDIAQDRADIATENAVEGQVIQYNVMINQSAVRMLGLGTPEKALGIVLREGAGTERVTDMTIVGVVADTHYQSLRKAIRPELYACGENGLGFMNVRFRGNPREALSAIRDVWTGMISDVPFVTSFADENLARQFKEEEALIQLLFFFAGFAVLVSCLGLYGLASFATERRTKEIGVRKVMGATVVDIVRLLVWQFTKPVLLANLIAWPIAVYGLLSWLEAFPYRLESWLLAPLCLGAGMLALLIAWATVGGNAARVARSNPIKALRYE
ncbi:MAG: ABC transporter permease [Alphaproteobacteria bacterium]|nr:MAG: ABC transporter permease [Alphaproteobacteria bacterium]